MIMPKGTLILTKKDKPTLVLTPKMPKKLPPIIEMTQKPHVPFKEAPYTA